MEELQNFQFNGSLFRNSTISRFSAHLPRKFNRCTTCPHFEIGPYFTFNGKHPKIKVPWLLERFPYIRIFRAMGVTNLTNPSLHPRRPGHPGQHEEGGGGVRYCQRQYYLSVFKTCTSFIIYLLNILTTFNINV